MTNLKIEIEMNPDTSYKLAREIEAFIIKKLDRSNYHGDWATSEVTGTDVTGEV